MDRPYTSIDQMQWAREGAMQGEVHYIAKRLAELEKQSKFLHQLCETLTHEQLSKVDGLLDFLLLEKQRELQKQQANAFLENELDPYLANEFVGLRKQGP